VDDSFESDFDIPATEPDIANSELWNCPKLLAFKCPQEWELLTPTDSPNVRLCDTCKRDVHRCATAKEFIHHGRLGHCVAIPNRFVPGEMTGGWLGEPSDETVRESEEQNQQILNWWSNVLGAEGAIDPEQASEVRKIL
jgi:hypothetical protein